VVGQDSGSGFLSADRRKNRRWVSPLGRHTEKVERIAIAIDAENKPLAAPNRSSALLGFTKRSDSSSGQLEGFQLAFREEPYRCATR
jgi:hypothetical protein